MTHEQHGKSDARLGIPWWRNPYRPGSPAAADWDRGHTDERYSLKLRRD